MDQQRPRWRIRISTLMLLIVILGLSLALVMEHQMPYRLADRAGDGDRADEADGRQVWAECRHVNSTLHT
jgi:hypothetical protein